MVNANTGVAQELKDVVGDFSGAFADMAVLFPILTVLSLKTNASPALLFGSAGIVYLTSGFIFRVPMAVQPLKALAAAAVTAGASFTEVRIAAAIVGLICLAAAFSKVGNWLARVPEVFVHGLQFCLGILLVFQGLKITSPGVAAALGVALVVVTLWRRWPVIGWIAFSGLLWGIFNHQPDFGRETTPITTDSSFRLWIILSLAMPQVALTMANSVIATRNVCVRFFGDRASRVTYRNLLTSIGLGNLLTSFLGGLPFCHGSGGVTAHVKGGAKSALSNFVMGFVLCALAIFQSLKGLHSINTPPWVLGGLLCATGLFHAALAEKSWRETTRIPVVATMAVLTLFTRDLLIALSAGVVVYLFGVYISSKRGKDTHVTVSQIS